MCENAVPWHYHVLGMALSVHAEGSGQFFQFDGESGTRKNFPGQTVRGRSGMPMNMEQMEKLLSAQ